MHQDQLTAVFDKQAAGYDQQWEAMAPIRDAVHFLTETTLVALPDDARILGVGVGTGVELAHLALRFPGWHVTAVEPSGAMLAVCRQRAEQGGFADRCVFHEGYLETLPDDESEAFDAATCFLVSQFIVDQDARSQFFRGIAQRLRPDGILVSSDLAAGHGADDFEMLLRIWLTVMAGPGFTTERLDATRAAYQRDVAVLPPTAIATLIEAGGFAPPVQIFQAGLLHAWCSQRANGTDS